MASRLQVNANLYEPHTTAVAEVASKLPSILNGLSDFILTSTGKNRPARPTDGDVIDALIASRALSTKTRSTLRAGKDTLKDVNAGLAKLSAAERQEMEASLAIVWAGRNDAERTHGIQLIAALFPGSRAADAVPHIRAMLRSGAGVIYPTDQQLASSRRSLPKAVYRDKGGVAAVDFGALVGGFYSGATDPRKIAAAAAVASAAALAEAVWDEIFGEDDDVPLFPGGTGPYNPCPVPNP